MRKNTVFINKVFLLYLRGEVWLNFVLSKKRILRYFIQPNAMSYTPVNISNSTAYPASGTVDYASIFCSNDQYSVAAGPKTSWGGPDRGVCLVTQITAVLVVDGQPVQAAPYTSTGTSYSQFAIVQLGSGFAVTRVTTALDSVDVGELQAEPTAQQK